MKTTVKVKFRPSTVADSPGSIAYQIIHQRLTRTITTDYKIYPKEWDAEHFMTAGIPQNETHTKCLTAIRQKLHQDLEQLKRIILRLEHRMIEYTPDNIAEEFQRMTTKGTLFHYMDNIINRLKKQNHIGTAHNYRAALNSFKRFRNDEDIPLEMIDYFLLEDYQSHLKQMKLAPNSISFYMRILRAVYNRAVKEELTHDRKPFRNAFTGMEKTAKRAIPINDIKRIKELELSSKPNIEFARDIFLFLFYCRGMSFIDAAFLRKTDIQYDILSYRRHKTGQLLHIKIIRQISSLIEKHSHKDSPYLFPIITNPGRNERKQYETALRHTNNALKIIATMADIRIPLTTYVTRHSWATIAKNKNIPVNVISDALGHDSISTTQIYLASIDASAIDNANELVIKDL